MNPLVSVLIPTRGRTGSMLEAVASFWDMAENPEQVEVIVRVHEDDPGTVAWALDHKSRVRVVIGDSERGYGSMDHFANCMAAVSNGDWLFGASDDFRMLTRGWDRLVREALKDPRREMKLLTAKVVSWPESRIGIMSRGLYRAIGHLGMTEYADCYVDSLTHFAGVQEKVAIEMSETGLLPPVPRDRLKTWAEYRSAETAWCFDLDKRKLGAALGREITEKWTPLQAPEKP